ncbi:MAG TPA: helix-turn-helix domain-containing protein, partial [Coriobacteriia bacterium]|nr:helix-turn-helix domain-containing protein [Coriobacteriia bacterium]
MTTADAAGRLGISQRQVQRLIAAGRLPATRTAGDAWVVDALTVNAMTRARPDRGRPWSPAAAWAALWRLSGLEVDWLDRQTTNRLIARLESIDAEELLHATRRRAIVRRFRVNVSFVAELRTAVVLSGTSAMTAANFGMEADLATLDGYCDSEALTRMVHDSHLVDDARGNATLRAAALRSLPIHGR